MAAVDLRQLFLESAVAGTEEPLALPHEGARALLSRLHASIGTGELLREISELVHIADFVLTSKRSPRCAEALLELSDAALKVARVLGDPAVEGYFPVEAAPSLDLLRARHQARSPAEHWYRPVTIDLEITQKCNLRCESCAIIEEVERGYDGLSGDEIVGILKSCEGSSIFSYSIVGGEPFLRIDDLCRAIAEVDLDLNRIQTNAKMFGSRARAREILGQLAAAGLAERNRELRPSINVSIGIQTDAGTPLANVAHLICEAIDLFGDRIALVLNVLPHDGSPCRDLVLALSSEYHRAIGEHLPWERIDHTHLMRMEYTPRAAKIGAVDDRMESIRERFSREDADTLCPNLIEKFDWSITPRCLVRADKSFFACSCFGYVASAGKVEGSVLPRIEAVNRDRHLRRILEGGSLEALYRDRIVEDPSLADRLIPRAAAVCKVCKALREPEAPLYGSRLPVLG